MKHRLGLGLLVVGMVLVMSRTLANVEPGPLAKKYELPVELYRQRCSTCHLGLPPEVLPSQSWREILTQEGHYGKKLPVLGSLERQLLWLYLKDFSRALKEDEDTPYTLSDSRYFRALHPKVALPSPINTQSCIQCHAGAVKGDFLVQED